MALTGRDKGEVRALIDEAIGKLGRHDENSQPLTATQRLARLEAYVYNLDLENRLLRLALHGTKERAAIEQIAQRLGITVDLEVEDDSDGSR